MSSLKLLKLDNSTNNEKKLNLLSKLSQSPPCSHDEGLDMAPDAVELGAFRHWKYFFSINKLKNENTRTIRTIEVPL